MASKPRIKVDPMRLFEHPFPDPLLDACPTESERARTTRFSEFIRNASLTEKEQVYTDVMKKASEKQNRLLEERMQGLKPLTVHMDNLDAWRLGQIAQEAGDPKRKDVGDPIDRGLVLLHLLNGQGYSITRDQPLMGSGAGKL